MGSLKPRGYPQGFNLLFNMWLFDDSRKMMIKNRITWFPLQSTQTLSRSKLKNMTDWMTTQV
jgi:hypothetical protein